MTGQKSKTATARFPAYGWAWPKGGRHLLLKAAILPDPEAAAGAFLEWHETIDFERVMMAEQRLLLPIARRALGHLLSKNVQARLAGVERMLWTHSMVCLRAAEPGLAALVAAGIEVMIFKGAARTAVDATALRGRFASDIDMLVRRADYDKALQVLHDMGWALETHGMRIDVARSIGVNLRNDKGGEIDLHKYPFHQVIDQDVTSEALWQRSGSHTFLNQTVQVPAATDQLMLAIAHGGVDGHETSDWLVDCALLIGSGEVDWDLFEALCKQRRLAAHAAIVLSYLSEQLEIDVPGPALERLKRSGKSAPFYMWAALFQSHPKREHTRLGDMGRGISRGCRQMKKARAVMRAERDFHQHGS